MIRTLLALFLLAACTTTPPPAQPFAPLNAFRAENGLKPLNPAPQLDAAARAHARDLTVNGLFSHTGSDGSSPGDRITAQGYTFCFAAENLYVLVFAARCK